MRTANKSRSEKLRYLKGHDNIRKDVSDEVIPVVRGLFVRTSAKKYCKKEKEGRDSIRRTLICHAPHNPQYQRM